MTVHWRAFELRPEPVELLDPKGDYLISAWRNHVYFLAEQLGIMMKMPSIQTRSRRAHEAAKWAETYGRMNDFHLAVFKAFFQSDLDINDIEVLVRLAEDLGMDGNALKNSLAGHEFTLQVVADEEEAMNIGVRAVPAFVSEGVLLAAGVQTVDRLAELLAAGPAGKRSSL